MELQVARRGNEANPSGKEMRLEPARRRVVAEIRRFELLAVSRGSILQSFINRRAQLRRELHATERARDFFSV